MNSRIRSYARKYDIRGRVNAEFGPAQAYSIGRGFARLLFDAGYSLAVIGHDIRETSLDFSEALSKGLIDSGINVIDCGLSITPMIKFASLIYNCGGSVMVTASHNEFTDNGFKFNLHKKPFYGDCLHKLCDIIDNQNFVDGAGKIEKKQVEDLYLKNMIKKIRVDSKIRVAWVSSNLFMKNLLIKLTRMLPGSHTIVNKVEDVFEYDVAFEFDTDADRMIMIDREHKRIAGDEALAIFAVIMKKSSQKLKAVFDLKSSRVLIKWLESIGIDCEICQVGSCFLDDKMRKTSADLGGELSGHFMFKNYNSLSDDGLYSACLMLHYLSSYSLKNIRSLLPEVHVSKSIRVKCPPGEDRFELMEIIKKHGSENKIINGPALTIQMQEGWLVIRPSETENVLTIRCEGFYKDGLQVVQEKADSLLSMVGLSLW